MDFETWLEYEYPFHSSMDFENEGQYNTWLGQMEAAFEAGIRYQKGQED